MPTKFDAEKVVKKLAKKRIEDFVEHVYTKEDSMKRIRDIAKGAPEK